MAYEDPIGDDFIKAIKEVCDRYGLEPLKFDIKMCQKGSFGFRSDLSLLWANPERTILSSL